MYVNVTCPSCGHGRINVEPQMLLQGASYGCISCGATLTLPQEFTRKAVRSADEFGGRRQKVGALKA